MAQESIDAVGRENRERKAVSTPHRSVPRVVIECGGGNESGRLERADVEAEVGRGESWVRRPLTWVCFEPTVEKDAQLLTPGC